MTSIKQLKHKETQDWSEHSQAFELNLPEGETVRGRPWDLASIWTETDTEC